MFSHVFSPISDFFQTQVETFHRFSSNSSLDKSHYDFVLLCYSLKVQRASPLNLKSRIYSDPEAPLMVVSRGDTTTRGASPLLPGGPPPGGILRRNHREGGMRSQSATIKCRRGTRIRCSLLGRKTAAFTHVLLQDELDVP